MARYSWGCLKTELGLWNQCEVAPSERKRTGVGILVPMGVSVWWGFPCGWEVCFPAALRQGMCPDCSYVQNDRSVYPRVPWCLRVALLGTTLSCSGTSIHMLAMTVWPGGVWLGGIRCLIWTCAVFCCSWLREDPGHEEILSVRWLGEYIAVPLDELEEVTVEKEVWAYGRKDVQSHFNVAHYIKKKHKRVPQDSRQQLKKLRVGNRYLAYFLKVP